jgi:hypothetical protein
MGRIGWLRGLKFVAIAVVAIAVLGAVVMALWNWLAPSLFSAPQIGFWQALGLLLLAKILFGGWRGGGRGYWRARMMDRWERMSDEEREKFRAGLRHRCGRAPEKADPPAPAA